MVHLGTKVLHKYFFALLVTICVLVPHSLFSATFTLSNKIQIESIHISDSVDRSALFGRSAVAFSTLDMTDLMVSNPFFIKSILEIEYDAEKEKHYLDNRRIFVTTGWLHAFELGAGENIIVWGKGDELNPTDIINAENYDKFVVLPKDRRKIPRPMATAKFGLNHTYLTLIGMPTIQRNKFPDHRSSSWCKSACQKSDPESVMQSFAGQGFQRGG